jgi:hypothetical protein
MAFLSETPSSRLGGNAKRTAKKIAGEGGRLMKTDEKERMLSLCERITKDKDSQALSELLKELNELLGGATGDWPRTEESPRKTNLVVEDRTGTFSD